MIPSGKILVTLYLISLSPLLACAQQFNFSAELDKVDTTGFYAITISPQLSAYIKADLADIRIADKNKQWVPHILQPGKAVLTEDLLTSFPILQNPVTDKKSTKYQDNPIPAFTQRDSNNISYVEVRQDDNYQFDKISLGISGSKFYSRDMEICLPYFSKSHLAKPGIIIGNFKLVSAQPPIYELPRTKTGLFFIIIKNADNPPLKIDTIFTQQQTVSLITYLEKGKKYDLLFGDSLASFADYDLQIFKDSITMIHPLNYGNVHAIKKIIAENEATNKNRWIWASIILAGIVLSFLTYRLTGDINKSKK